MQVDKVFDTHQLGFEWYKENNLQIPSNCMVENSLPYNFDQTSSNFETSKEIKEYLLKNDEVKKKQGQVIINLWDKRYKESTNQWKMFVKTKPLYVELDNPVSLYRTDLENIFGQRIPNTRNAPGIKFHQLEKLALIAGIKIVTEENCR